MAKRKIVKIDQDKCTGCGLCVNACAEAAIEIVDGKARMVGEVFCDGLGACLGKCPEDAITIEEREAEEFDERAVARRMRQLAKPAHAACPSAALREFGHAPAGGGCPSAALRDLSAPKAASAPAKPGAELREHRLRSWPIQLALVPPHAPFLKGADVVLAADCTAFARPALLPELASGRPLLIACPKLDDTGAYVDKLADIFEEAHPRTLTVVHMTVPCCHGLAHVVRQALESAGADVPVTEVTIGIEGEIESTETWAAEERVGRT